jgi:hypothetical protein
MMVCFSENSTALSDDSVISVNYGLFNGQKTLKGKLDISPVPYSLTGQTTVPFHFLKGILRVLSLYSLLSFWRRNLLSKLRDDRRR